MAFTRVELVSFVALMAVGAGVVAWHKGSEARKMQFIDELQLVGFSRTSVGSPSADEERRALERAEQLGIELLTAYEENLNRDARFSLAWMLISQESAEYYARSKQNLKSTPWPEVRVWALRHEDESLSFGYRAKLLDLLLTCPRSEAKLLVAQWYTEKGRLKDAEDAYYAAMRDGPIWDALYAADQLLESERYRRHSVWYLLFVLRESDPFIPRAAECLLRAYDLKDESQTLLQSCRGEGRDGPNRKKLLAKLTPLVEQDLARKED